MLAAPFLLVTAVAIRLDTRGPALYRQRRVGKGGEVFEMCKLRTMVTGSDPTPAETWEPLCEDDPRVTPVGAVLRRMSLDEVPNLLNVLRGEMAIVGPRPTIEAQVEQYTPPPAPQARGPAGDHRVGAGQRAGVTELGGSDRARHLVRGESIPRAGPEDPRADGAADPDREGAVRG